MKSLYFLFGGCVCTSLLPHCAAEGPVLELVGKAQTESVPTSHRLFVFDEKCRPITAEIRSGMSVRGMEVRGRIRLKPETDTLFLQNERGEEDRLVAREIDERQLARMLGRWLNGTPCIGVLCFDDDGHAQIVNLQEITQVTFDRTSIILPPPKTVEPSETEVAITQDIAPAPPRASAEEIATSM